MQLPASFVNEHKAIGETISMFGVQVEMLERDELIATIGFLMKEKNISENEHKRQRKFLFDLMKAKK